MVNINDKNSYEPVRKKRHTAFACMPPKCKIVVNRLISPELAKKYGSTCDFTSAPMELISMLQEGAVSLTSPYYPIILCNTRGAMRLATVEEILWNYECNGEMSLKRLQKGWVSLTSTPPDKRAVVACFVPKNQQGVLTIGTKSMEYNNPLIEHGAGDFIVCEGDEKGAFDWSKRYVVNGLVFKDMFHNTGWVGDIMCSVHEPPLNVSDLKNICNVDNRTVGVSHFSWSWLQFAVAESAKYELILPTDWTPAKMNTVSYTSFLTAMFTRAFQDIQATLPQGYLSCNVFVRNTDDTLINVQFATKDEDLDVGVRMLVSCRMAGDFKKPELTEIRMIMERQGITEDYVEIQRDKQLLNLPVTTTNCSTYVEEHFAKRLSGYIDAARTIKTRNGKECKIF